MEDITTHSKIGASSCERFWNCEGSIALGDKAKREGMVKESSRFAKEGTAAHMLAEQCLKQNVCADDFIDCRFDVEGEVFTVNQEMANAVQVYLDKIEHDINNFFDDVNVKFGYEEKFCLSDLDEEAYGTNDAYLFVPSEKLLIVYDYKHGKGIAVEVMQNRQLLYYALGCLQEHGYNHLKSEVERVRLVIVQPRCKHKDGGVREEDYGIEYLMNFRNQLLTKILATKKPVLELHAGKHCKFCPATLICSIAEKNVWRGGVTVSVSDAIEAFN